MWIPLKTRHREVAPNQFEFAHCTATHRFDGCQGFRTAVALVQQSENIVAGRGEKLATLSFVRQCDGVYHGVREGADIFARLTHIWAVVARIKAFVTM